MKNDPITVTLDYSDWLTILDALDEREGDLAHRNLDDLAEETKTIREKIEASVEK